MSASSIRPAQAASGCLAFFLLGTAFLWSAPVQATPYGQTNLVTDSQAALTGLGYAPAAHVDPNLVNPWGISSSSTSPFWVSDNGKGVATLYNSGGIAQPLVVAIPPTPSAPTGQISTSIDTNMSDFQVGGGKARFVFATENGTIAAWQGGTSATTVVPPLSGDASYKGLAIGSNASGFHLYAADFGTGTVDVFDNTFAHVTLAGTFVDPTLPTGYAPFNVQVINGALYVTYALRNPVTGDDVGGQGHGFVDKFDLNGNFLARIISGGVLNSPWALDIAPAQFGKFSNDLLVGNFGNGKINVFDPTSFAFLGTLSQGSNQIAIDGLWGLINGNGGSGGDPNRVYFAAGIDDEAHGLFGSLQAAPAPEPGTLALFVAGLLGFGLAQRKRRPRTG